MARVLIVDADQRVRSSLRSVLERRHHEVHEAANGKEGLSKAIQLGVDVVFTDVFGSDVAGLELIEAIRASAPSVRIVAMSSGDSAKSMAPLAAAVNLGAAGFLIKPFSVDDVVAVLREVLPAD